MDACVVLSPANVMGKDKTMGEGIMEKLTHTEDGYIIRFGKYEGKMLENVIRNDPGYINWCMGHLDDETTDTIDFVVGEMILLHEIPWNYWDIAERGDTIDNG